MQIIVSHDVDHLYVSEHYRDMIIPKHLLRSKIEFLSGKISFAELVYRFSEIIDGRLHRIEELMDFDLSLSIPSTFFTGVNKGLGLNYSKEKASVIVRLIQSKGFDAGVHGIAYDELSAIQKERNDFARIAGHSNFGIRMHYLRGSSVTLPYLSDAGYAFDCSDTNFGSTYKVGNLTEFPVHIMDGWIINKGRSWQSVTAEQALESSKRLIEEGLEKGIDYFSVLFHDRYFSEGFITWRDWYTRFMDWLQQNDFEFTSYKTALKAMEV